MIPFNLLQVLLLTKNEAPNIARVLDKLTWIERIVIVDSFSTDGTLSIVEQYSNVVLYQHKFESFALQCNFGLSQVTSEWVLSLDADYVLTDEFIIETTSFIQMNQKEINAYFSRFHFLVFGKPLLNDNTTPRAVLFRCKFCTYYDDGHAHRLRIEGKTGKYTSRILHDDRKSLSRWLDSQSKYSIQEAEKLLFNPNTELSFISKIRKTKLFAPFFVFFYCLFVQALIFNGWRGWYYTLQRTMVEMLFALRLIEYDHFNKENENL